jgi:transcriptional regulator with XRE-family HTH domain
MSATSKLGSLLRRLREEKKMTQGQLAEASGVSRVQIARLETAAQGRGAKPRHDWNTMTGLAKAFGVTAEEFATMLDQEQPAKVAPRRGRPKKAKEPTPAKPVRKRKKS